MLKKWKVYLGNSVPAYNTEKNRLSEANRLYRSRYHTSGPDSSSMLPIKKILNKYRFFFSTENSIARIESIESAIKGTDLDSMYCTMEAR